LKKNIILANTAATLPTGVAKVFNLKDILLSQGLLSSDQLAIAEIEYKHSGKKLETVLIEQGFITDKVLATLTAHHAGLKEINICQMVLDPNVVAFVPQNICAQYRLIPLTLEDQILFLAMADVYDILALDEVQKHCPMLKLVPVVATADGILKAIDLYYGYKNTFESHFQEIEKQREDGRSHLTHEDTSLSTPTVRLVDAVIMDAAKQGASDIHFQPEDIYVRIRYRIDGLLSQINIFHKDYWPAICIRLKILAEMNIAESRKPQNGRFTYLIGLQEIDCRVSSHPSLHGESLVLRLLDKRHGFMKLEQLDLPKELVSDLKALSMCKQGLMIITGPTGSGKTTTLYTLLNELNSHDINIMTLEEPIEYKFPLIRQTEIRDNFNFSFADGVRSILRQDPDIILIGEIRDEETAKMALRAAMTGHLVLTTLHTTSCFGVLPRLQDLGISPSMLAGYMLGTLGQRLIRILCKACQTTRPATPLESKFLNLNADTQIPAPQGCKFCHFKGYNGRTTVMEFLHFDEVINCLLSEPNSQKEIKSYAMAKGFIPLMRRCIELVLKGHTTLEEAQRCIHLNIGQ
jgi:type II secretory ATPase GspE/PulE/Tfp pilus assembly ATPase PilB-like protein